LIFETFAQKVLISFIDGVKAVSSPSREKVEQYKVPHPIDDDNNGDFFAYSDPSDSNIMNMEGLVKFFSDLNIDGERVDSLYLLYIMDTEELDRIRFLEYKNMLKKAGASNTRDARHFIDGEVNRINNSESDFKKFMSFIFRGANIDNPMSKYIISEK
jgi:hypothetical protein